jgi:hypothetical protein
MLPTPRQTFDWCDYLYAECWQVVGEVCLRPASWYCVQECPYRFLAAEAPQDGESP